ncbi:unnamed protein product [Colias eurytheme]|nr:unnamed protein product [Colias eurytheme]
MLVILFVLVLLYLAYFYSIRNFNYWQIRKVPFVQPYPFFGSCRDIYLMKKSVSQFCEAIYENYPNEKVVGLFRSSQPVLLVRDPNILKRILITDFSSFYLRGLNPHKPLLEPMFRNLFFADGDLWRLLRQRMTHAFTGAKLRAMFPLIAEKAERLKDRVSEVAADGGVTDAHELMARYATDFIGSCGFGIDADSLNDDDSAFRSLGKSIFKYGLREAMLFFLKDTFPSYFKHLKYIPQVERELIKLVRDIQEDRGGRPSGRNDFIDILMECKRSVTTGESMEHKNEDGTPLKISLEMDDALLAAQVFIFFAAGFETSSVATSFTLHQLAHHPHVQAKAHSEIDTVLAQHGNQITYEAIQKMTYLECVFKEGMRMLTPIGYVTRECAKKYAFPDINLTIDKGVLIVIPLQAFHNDPQHFENPDEFVPERFLSSDFGAVDKDVFNPFGSGPRTCIGERLGTVQSLAGLVAVLRHCSVRPAPHTPPRPPLSPTANVVQAFRGGLPLAFTSRTRQ